MVEAGVSQLDGERGVCYRPRIVVTLGRRYGIVLMDEGEEKKLGSYCRHPTETRIQ